MTCALRAARVEKKAQPALRRHRDGQLRHGRAQAAFPETLTPADLIAQVEKTEHTAHAVGTVGAGRG
jgi:hypothetical protein